MDEWVGMLSGVNLVNFLPSFQVESKKNKKGWEKLDRWTVTYDR